MQILDRCRRDRRAARRNGAASWLSAAVWLVLGPLRCLACYINGVDIGVCDSNIETDYEYRTLQMPFCGAVVSYTACVPLYNPLSPSRDHPLGRWYNNTISIKDSWVEQRYDEVIATRMAIEKNSTLQKKGIDEYGDSGAPVPRFIYNTDCRDAYRNYMCWINFPRCSDGGESMATCRSACENLMIACEYQTDLWRCGASEYFNGDGAESPTYDDNGDVVYRRDFFPGQPFQSNAFHSDGDPIAVCTPSIKGAAAALRPTALWAAAAAALAVALAAAGRAPVGAGTGVAW